MSAVARYQVARSRFRTAYDVAVGFYEHAVAAVTQGEQAIHVGADAIALHYRFGGEDYRGQTIETASSANVDSSRISGNEVSRPCFSASDDVGGADNNNPRTAQRGGAVPVRADEVALHQVVAALDCDA